jgi:hypothetical protein
MTTQIEDIGAVFAANLREHASNEQWQDMLDANAAETNSAVCHSHDFIDANEVMMAAYQSVTGLDPFGEDDFTDHFWSVVTPAWEHARINYLGGRAAV